ncbi:hypothetical protein K0U83_18670 [bacterium]|nr:hypothetical protein [bacterium]
MGLRDLAEQDLGVILEGDAYGFRWSLTVTDPEGLSASTLYGFSDDISQTIDPDTGQLVSGRLASVAIRNSSLTAAGFADLPRGGADSSAKPWIVEFNDINGNAHTFKIRQANPDRALGVVTCILEAYDV